MLRKITNIDAKRGKKKSIWFIDTASEQTETRHSWTDSEGVVRGGEVVPSRYGPSRETVANCMSVQDADFIVAAWNEKVDREIVRRSAADWGRL